MNCLEFRRAVGADPNYSSAEALAHRAQCPACEKYAQEMLRLDALIKRALEIPVRASSRKASASPQRWLALAASVVLVIGFGAAFWFLSYAPPSLADAVVAHLNHEPDAMSPSEARISAEQLNAALKTKGMHLDKPLDNVSYVQSCLIRGDFVPHLVVQTARGPVTVILLPKESVSGAQKFEEQKYRGVLIPMTRGSFAVVATDPALVDSVADVVKSTISVD